LLVTAVRYYVFKTLNPTVIEIVIEKNQLKSMTTLVIKKDFLGFMKEHFVYIAYKNHDG